MLVSFKLIYSGHVSNYRNYCVDIVDDNELDATIASITDAMIQGIHVLVLLM